MTFRWTEHQRCIAEVVLRHRQEEGSGYNLNAVQQELPGVSSGTISKVAKALRDNGWAIPAKGEEKEKPPKEREGGKLAVVVAKQPAPVVFVLGEHRIELETEAIYESYLLYQDIKQRYALNDSFSNVLRDGVALMWQILVGEKGK